MRRKTALAAAALSLAGSAAAEDYYSDVRPLIETKCVGCHSDAGVSFSLEDPELAYSMRAAIALAVSQRRMPPWLAEPGHQQYLHDPSLTPDELRLIAAWAEQGYPKGEPHGTAAAVPSDAHRHFAADLTLEVMAGEAYLPNQSRKDDYRCFVIDWPLEQPAYITGFRALPGNLRVAHHLVLFAVEPHVADRFKALDAAEEGLGYQCFGGAVPDRLGDRDERAAYERDHPNGVRELNDANFWLAHWAPGMDGYEFPQGTGILMQPGMVVIAQMHYYASFAPGESDAGSKMQFQLSDSVEKPALHLPLTNDGWLYGAENGSLVVPPGGKARYEVTAAFDGIAEYVARYAQVAPESIRALEVHSANLHMHRFGAAGVVSLIDPNGRKDTLLAIPRWDLNWQRDFTFVEPKVVPRRRFARTHLAVECAYDNYTSAPVYGGFGSDDEMCFNFSYVAIVRD